MAASQETELERYIRLREEQKAAQGQEEEFRGISDGEEELDDEDEADEDDGGGWQVAGSSGSHGSDDGQEGDNGWTYVGGEAGESSPPPAKRRKLEEDGSSTPVGATQQRAAALAELSAASSSMGIMLSKLAEVLKHRVVPGPAATDAQTKQLQETLASLREGLLSLAPSTKGRTLNKLRKKLGKKVAILPSPEGAEWTKWSEMDLKFAPPSPDDVRLVGPWSWSGATREAKHGLFTVDLAVSIPSELLQPKDYLYPRFSVKAAHYLLGLASVADQWAASLGPVEMSMEPIPFSTDELLVLTPSSGKGARIAIRCAWGGESFAESPFVVGKLAPGKNFARPPEGVAEGAAGPPTPVQSSAFMLGSASIQASHLILLHDVATSLPTSTFALAVALLQDWSKARNYNAATRSSFHPLGVTGDNFWAFCVAKTLEGGMAGIARDNKAQAALTVVTRTLQWLADADFKGKGVVMRGPSKPTFDVATFKAAFPAGTFLDPTSGVNLLAGISSGVLANLKLDAASTISHLTSSFSLGADEAGKFDRAFGRSRRLPRWDVFGSFSLPAEYPVQRHLDLTSSTHAILDATRRTLERALGTRTKGFHIWETDARAEGKREFAVGIWINHAEAVRLVDHGPSAEDKAGCAEFSKFWGPLSSLRRFKDGKITESVAWNEVPAIHEGGLGIRRNKIIAEIVRHVLVRHHAVSSDEVHFASGELDGQIVESFKVRQRAFSTDSVQSNRGFTSVISAFDQLSTDLKSLTDIPLGILTVLPIGPALRLTSVLTPSARNLTRAGTLPDAGSYPEPVELVITLESSRKWGTDVEEIRKIKAAFLERYAAGLKGLKTIASAALGVATFGDEHDDTVFVDVITQSGFTFRLYLEYDKHVAALRALKGKRGGFEGASMDEEIESLNRRYVWRRRHHDAIASLQGRLPTYSNTVRLLKRWFAASLLGDSVPLEAIELIAASVFLDKMGYPNLPRTAEAGFARCLERLAEWDWRAVPLVLPLFTAATSSSGEVAVAPVELKVAAGSAFKGLRARDAQIDKGFAWVIATEDDAKGEWWTEKVSKLVAGSTRALAARALSVLDAGAVVAVKDIFAPQLSAFDFVIHFNPTALPRHLPNLSVSPADPELAQQFKAFDSSSALIAADPAARLVRQVGEAHADQFVLFYSTGMSLHAAAIWNPVWLASLVPKGKKGKTEASLQLVEEEKRKVVKEVKKSGGLLVLKVVQRR